MIPIGDDLTAHRRPRVMHCIIALCLIVFLWQQSLPDAQSQLAALRYGLVPALLTGEAVLAPGLEGLSPWLTLITSMFLHGGWGHLLGNLLYLWIFGNNVEDRLGHLGFGLFYVVCGVCAAASQVLPEPGSTIPMIGASGAISGVLGAYLVLFPRANVVVFVPFSVMFIHRIQAFWMLCLWFALQIVSGLAGSPSAAGVAWWAHVGGFVAGAGLALPFRPTPDRRAARRRTGPWG